jgi:hypothetical protein
MSAVVLDNSLYALGSYDGGKLSTVQKLSLDRLTWELMQLKLPKQHVTPASRQTLKCTW